MGILSNRIPQTSIDDIDIVLPVTDLGVEFVVRNKKVLTKFVAIPLLPELEPLHLVNDKWLLYCFAQKSNFPVPSTVLIGEAGGEMYDSVDLEASVEEDQVAGRRITIYDTGSDAGVV